MVERGAHSAAPDAAIQRRWLVSRIVFGVGIFFVVMITLGLWVNFEFDPLGGVIRELLPVGETPPGWAYPVLIYVGYFALPAIVFLPVLLPAAVTWRDPRRVIVFRRFNTPRESRALRRIATRHFGRFGHVFTLADQRIRRSWFVRIPAVFGQLSLLHFRPRRVVTGRRLARLTRLLEQRWRLNVNWLVSYRKIFPIESSDDYWQACVGTLLEHADVIVMDISNFSASMSWELEECERRQLLDRTILLVDDEKVLRGTSSLERLPAAVGAAVVHAPFSYHGTTVSAPGELRRAVVDICSARGVVRTDTSPLDVFATVASTLALSVVLAGAATAATAPYVWPRETARYSPIKSQVLTAYFVTRDPALLSGILETDREWTLDGLRRSLTEEFRSHAAAVALGNVGDERDIPLLVAFLGNRPPPRDDPRDTWWSRSVITPLSRRVEEDSLVGLVQRLGAPALAPLLEALGTVPHLSFEFNLYSKYVAVEAAGVPSAMFEPLLTAPSQAGRFIAALQLAPLEDVRTIPILLEMSRTPGTNPDWSDARLRKFDGTPGLRGSWLDPYLFGDDKAAEQAARLALSAPDVAYLADVVTRVPPGSGKQLLRRLVDTATAEEPASRERARALLVRASVDWVQSLLEDADDGIKSKAVYARAEQGDASILPLALRLSKQPGRCETMLFVTYECKPYEAEAIAALELLRKSAGGSAPRRLSSTHRDRAP